MVKIMRHCTGQPARSIRQLVGFKATEEREAAPTGALPVLTLIIPAQSQPRYNIDDFRFGRGF